MKTYRDEIIMIIIDLLIILYLIVWAIKSHKEPKSAAEETNAYYSETYKDQEDNKTYKIIKDKLGDVIFCEEIQEEET